MGENEKCTNCAFWNQWTEHKGYCRRHAPRPYYVTIIGEGTVEDEEVGWPITDATDWCGEFKPRAASDADQ